MTESPKTNLHINPDIFNDSQIGIGTNYTIYTSPYSYFNLPKQSNYTCYMFGNRPGGSGIVYTPQEGRVPNAWVRFWMKVFFDCNWVKK